MIADYKEVKKLQVLPKLKAIVLLGLSIIYISERK